MFEINVNNTYQWKIESLDNNRFLVDGNEIALDFVALPDGSLHIIQNNKGYRAVVVEMNKAEKSMVIEINGNRYELALKDKFDLLLKQLGMSGLVSKKINDLKAPMPGKVLQVLVTAGSAVKKGEPVLVLEAMKMENVLKAPADVSIKEVKVQQGDAVEKNTVLVVFE